MRTCRHEIGYTDDPWQTPFSRKILLRTGRWKPRQQQNLLLARNCIGRSKDQFALHCIPTRHTALVLKGPLPGEDEGRFRISWSPGFGRGLKQFALVLRD